MSVAPRSSSRTGAGRRAERAPADASNPFDAPPALPLLTLVWDSPFPASLQDASFRFVDVNPAFAAFIGIAREALIGVDFADLLFEEDRASTIASRKRFVDVDGKVGQIGSAYSNDGRLRHSDGQERWFRAARHVIQGDDGQPLFLAMLQDTTSEHAARERADRSVRELDDWFDLSPVGMVLFDDSGLLVRRNPAFDAMAGSVPLALDESAPGLARLLAWGQEGLQQLQPGSRPIENEGWLTRPDGQMRRLRAIVRCYRTAAGQRRFMGIVEDRSVEEERDLAQMQVGALMDTAGVGIATFQESSGWVLQRSAGDRRPSARVPQITGRDRVSAESLADYDRLQRALERNERAEARYAIEHPKLGRRWLLTRVEPATLASGKKTASIVTQDVTDQQRSQSRSEQLLREMTTILESATAGIAYLRDGRLVRCNHRFEVMLRLPAGGSVGAGLADLLARHPRSADMAADSDAALAADALYEAEFAFGGDADAPSESRHGASSGESESRWYALSVRRAGGRAATDEAIAVLSDVTRMKTQQVQLESLASEREGMASRTRAILDSVLVGIVTVGANGIEWMNRSAQRMFAGSLEDFVGQPMSVVATAEADHPFLARDLPAEPADGQSRTFECRVRGRDGRTFWIVGNAFETPDAAGGRQLTYALLDIERRRQAEAAVFEAQASLRRVIEAAPLAIALLDAKTLTVAQINDVAARTVGELPEDLLGTTPEDIFGAELGAVRRRDMEQALRTRGLTQREYRFEQGGEMRIWDARYLPLAADDSAAPDQLLLVANDVTEQRAAEEARLEAAIAQREMLVKEVHHRIKNNLQGVAGLLQQIAQRKPEMATAIDEVVSQVQAIAQVHGLQVGAGGPLSVVSILAAITSSVQRTFGRSIRCDVTAAGAAAWMLPEVESIPIALTINELLTNAVKHSAGSDPADDIVCALECDVGGVCVSISNTAVLAAGFSLARIPNGVSGLGLVRALLPRRSATLRIGQFGAQVMATVTLRPPVVARAPGA